MSTELILMLCLAAWASVGVVLSVMMGRRGRSPAAWLIIGVLLGPLAIPVALDARWHRHPRGVSILTTAPTRPGLRVLAAVDGSPEAVTALERAVALLGDRIGRLTLAYVTDYDAAEDPALFTDEETRAGQWMTEAREAAAGGLPAEECVLMGDPATTLAHLAADERYDLLVVGNRGRGLSPRLFGSVAGSLARSSPVPVLIGGQHHAAAREPLAAGAQTRPER